MHSHVLQQETGDSLWDAHDNLGHIRGSGSSAGVEWLVVAGHRHCDCPRWHLGALARPDVAIHCPSASASRESTEIHLRSERSERRERSWSKGVRTTVRIPERGDVSCALPLDEQPSELRGAKSSSGVLSGNAPQPALLG